MHTLRFDASHETVRKIVSKRSRAAAEKRQKERRIAAEGKAKRAAAAAAAAASASMLESGSSTVLLTESDLRAGDSRSRALNRRSSSGSGSRSSRRSGRRKKAAQRALTRSQMIRGIRPGTPAAEPNKTRVLKLNSSDYMRRSRLRHHDAQDRAIRNQQALEVGCCCSVSCCTLPLPTTDALVLQGRKQRKNPPPRHKARHERPVHIPEPVPEQSVRMAKFQHVQGAQVCSHLYKHFTLPDGSHAHYYHDDILSEVTNSAQRATSLEVLSLATMPSTAATDCG